MFNSHKDYGTALYTAPHRFSYNTGRGIVEGVDYLHFAGVESGYLLTWM